MNRAKIKRNTIFYPEKFEDGPQFALILNDELSQIQISTISKQLSMHGLTVLQTQSLDRKKNILFVELSNSIAVFQEAQELQIRKKYKLTKSQMKAEQIQQIIQSQQNIQQQTMPPLLKDVQTYTTFGTAVSNPQSSMSNGLQSPTKIQVHQVNGQNNFLTEQSYKSFKGNQERDHELVQPSLFTFDLNSPSMQNTQQDNYLTSQIKNVAFDSSSNSPNNSQDPIQLLTKQQIGKLGENGSLQTMSSHQDFQVKVSKNKGKKLLDEIDPRILSYEKLKVITTGMLFDLDKEGNRVQKNKGLGIFTPAERLRITYSFMNKIRIKDLRFLEYLQEQELVTEIIPMHDKNVIMNDSIQSIEDYYGENISSYFEFLDVYQKWLLYPAIFGLVTYMLANKFPNSQLYFYFLYTIFICFWTTLFYIHWKRCESELQVKWGVFGKKIYKEDRQVNFRGLKRIKITTMCEEEYYPRSKRFHLYILSALESLPLLSLAFFLKIIIFNLNGLINSKNSFFYLESVAKLTQEDGILSSLPLKDSILNVVMIVVIIKINEIYMTISSNSTKRENHRTNNDFNSSLVIKRFIFDLINRFTHFFFIAFVIRDINSLKNLLGSLFMMDEIRKIATESVIPWAMKKFLSTKKQKESSPDDDNTIKKNEELNQLYTESIREVDMWPYDDFDDYIEVVAQIAFITLFAAVTPIAAFLSYLFNILERSSDKFKLSNRLYRRPLPFKVQGINAWNKVIFLISIICIFTNVAFLSFEYYNIYDLQQHLEHNQVCVDQERQGHLINEMSETADKLETTWMNVYISMFTIEHIILLIITAFHYLIPLQPKWVRVYRRRMANKSHLEECQT